MRLHNITEAGGGARPRKRVGHGRGSGRGKTCGRGHKGQKSRAGSSQRPGFESGHVPLYRKLPKRGFNNYRFRKEYAIVNVGDLAALETSGEVDRKILEDKGLVRRGAGLIKILGGGEIDRPLTVKADKFSKSAKEKIGKAGGQTVTASGEKAPGGAAGEAEKTK